MLIDRTRKRQVACSDVRNILYFIGVTKSYARWIRGDQPSMASMTYHRYAGNVEWRIDRLIQNLSKLY